MNLCSSDFLCFSLRTQSQVKTFQMQNPLFPSHFFKIIQNSFEISKNISPFNICFSPMGLGNEAYSLEIFCQNAEKLIKDCQVFNLIIRESQLDPDARKETFWEEIHQINELSPFFSPNPKRETFDKSHISKSLIKENGFEYSSPKVSSFLSLDRLFIQYLTEMLDDGKIEGKQFYFLKCIYFEQRGFLMDFVLEALKHQDYPAFASIIEGILALKQGQNIFSKPRNDVIFPESTVKNNLNNVLYIEQFFENKFDEAQAEILKKLLRKNDPLVIAGIDLFEQDNDEEELLDTMTRLIKKIEIESIKKPKLIENIEEKSLKIENEEEKTKENKTKKEKTKKNINNLENHGNEKHIDEIKSSNETPKIAASNSNVPNNQPNQSFLAAIFKTFLEETEEEFQNYQVGMARYFFSISYPPLIEVLNTATTIESAVESFKELIEPKFLEYLSENFNSIDVDYIHCNKADRNNEIFTLFLDFKDTGNLEKLSKSLKSVLEVKRGDLYNSGCSQTQRKFSSVAILRNQNKKPSFKMLLLKDATQTIKIPGEESQAPMIVTINQGDNPLLKDLLHKYHIREDLGNDKINKNLKIFDDLKKKCGITGDSEVRLRELLNRNHFSLLKVLNIYEKFNMNPKKVKKEVEKLCKIETFNEFPDIPNSPCLRNKLYKLNAFKQVIHELLDRYQLISAKQQKLYIYLYMEEDIVILGVFELFLLTGELQDFIENLRIIDKFHFFKTNLDLDEIEQFDENIEYQLSLLFAYKKYLSSDQVTSLETIIRAGDNSLLELFKSYKDIKEKEFFIKGLVSLAEEKTKALFQLEKKMRESRVNDSIVEKNLETLETFRASKFLKKVKFYEFLVEMVENQHKLIQTAFEIYDMTKDKADFIENMELIYIQAYKRKCVETLEIKLKSLGLKDIQKHFLLDCIELDIPNILGPFDVFFFKLQTQEESEKDALSDLQETMRICLKQYSKEIILFDKTFYK